MKNPNSAMTMNHPHTIMQLLRCVGGDFVSFCRSLNNLHLHISLGIPAMISPEFSIANVTSTSLEFHYHSRRQGYSSWVIGILKAVGHQIYGIEVNVELTARRKDGTSDHEVFQVTYHEGEGHFSRPLSKLMSSHDSSGPSSGQLKNPAAKASTNLIGIGPENFCDLFPFHIVFDLDLSILQVGHVLQRLLPDLLEPGARINSHFELKHPWTWDLSHLMRSDANKVVIVTKQGLEIKGGFSKIQKVVREGKVLSESREVLLFMGSPRPYCLDDLTSHHLYLSDFPHWDMGADYVLLSEQLKVEAELKGKAEEMNQELAADADWLMGERKRVDEANAMLKDSLAKALASNTGAMHKSVELNTMTPAALAIKLLDSLMIGEEVDAQQVLAVREALLNSGSGSSLWKPVDIADGAIGRALGGDEEVNAALELMLIGKTDRGGRTANYEDMLGGFASVSHSTAPSYTLDNLLHASGSHAKFHRDALGSDPSAVGELPLEEVKVMTLSKTNSSCPPSTGIFNSLYSKASTGLKDDSITLATSPFAAPSFHEHLGGPSMIRAPVVPVTDQTDATPSHNQALSSGGDVTIPNVNFSQTSAASSPLPNASSKKVKRRNSIMSLLSGAFASEQPGPSEGLGEEKNKKKVGKERRKSFMVREIERDREVAAQWLPIC